MRSISYTLGCPAVQPLHQNPTAPSLATMIVPIEPPLQGIAIDRFHALAKALTDARQRGHEDDLQTLLAEDLAWADAHLDPETNAVIAYEAAARVLVDLVRSGCFDNRKNTLTTKAFCIAYMPDIEHPVGQFGFDSHIYH